jgi:hypothetical protein
MQQARRDRRAALAIVRLADLGRRSAERVHFRVSGSDTMFNGKLREPPGAECHCSFAEERFSSPCFDRGRGRRQPGVVDGDPEGLVGRLTTLSTVVGSTRKLNNLEERL